MTKEVIFEIIAFSCLMVSVFTSITTFMVLGIRAIYKDLCDEKKEQKSKVSRLDDLLSKLDDIDERLCSLHTKYVYLSKYVYDLSFKISESNKNKVNRKKK